MKTTKLFLAAILLTFGKTAHAQFANTTSGMGTYSGTSTIVKDCADYNRFNFMFSSLNVSAEKMEDEDLENTYPGFQIGWIGGYSLSNSIPLFVESGMDFSFNTKIIDEGETYGYDYELRASMASLTVPLHVAYKLSFANGAYISPYAGIHFKVNVLGKEKMTLDDEKETADLFDDDDMDGDPCNRFQVGWRIGTNIGYKAFNFNVGYMSDFIPLWKEKKYKLNTSAVTVGLGINF